MITPFGEYGTDTLLRQLEAVDDGLTLEIGIEEKFFLHNDLVDIFEQLLVGE